MEPVSLSLSVPGLPDKKEFVIPEYRTGRKGEMGM